MRLRLRLAIVLMLLFFAFSGGGQPLFAQPAGVPALSGMPAGPATAATDSVAIGRAVHLVVDPGGEGAGLVVDLSAETKANVEALNDPPRLVIDLEGVTFSGALSATSGKGVGPVSGWRVGGFLTGRSRIVLDLAKSALIERIDFVRQAGAVRLVAQVQGVPSARFLDQVRADRERRLASRKPDAEPAPIARKPGQKPLIVIDPGHGGIDPGASGAKGEVEKDLVLAVGRALRKALIQDARIEVQMTREDDRFIPLGERVSFARSRGAALFISLHADSLAGEADVRGASVYTLGDRASDADAARAAEKENRSDQIAGLDVTDEAREGVDDILFDLARRETRMFSQIVARHAASAIRQGARLHKTPLRSAGFRVLRAPDMPSILVELGYLSNPEDVAMLTSEAAREKLAQAMAEAFIRFVISGRDAISAKAPE